MPLRRFELDLLSELGYRTDWELSACGQPIRSDQRYVFEADRGFRIADFTELNRLLARSV